MKLIEAHRRLADSLRAVSTSLGVLAVAVLVAGCATVDFEYPREASQAIEPSTDTSLKRGFDQWLEENPGPSGFYPLFDGSDALGVRLRLIARAEKSIDIQYFLMKADTAGFTFGTALVEAANRGVRIRFLLDDIFTTIEDRELQLLERHENIEVRLYNPVAGRGTKMFGFVGDFQRANRRMHNKSFTVDNQVTIVGGRNIADEYFGIETRGEFMDLDVVGIGPVAAEVSEKFDRFWNDDRAVPLAAVTKPAAEEELDELGRQIRESYLDKVLAASAESQTTSLVEALFDDRQRLFSADADVITDDPEKLYNRPGSDYAILATELGLLIEQAESEVMLLTPYFVPGKDGIEYWRSLVEQGVRVVIVTNSLATNNHTAVHSGYSRYRKRVLDAGVELYEIRVDGGRDPNAALTLHTKAFLIDREKTFIGSLNLDPRSLDINTEMGVVIKSREMAEGIAEVVDEQLPVRAWRLGRDESGGLTWTSIVNGETVVETSEPDVGFGRKLQAFFLKVMPESQL
jgi:putative cardiolipin synthase